MLSSVILQSFRLAYASHLPLHKGGFSKFPPTKKHHQRKILGGVFSAKNAEQRRTSFLILRMVLGYAASAIGFDKETWLDVVAATVPAKTVEINKKAFVLGYEATK